MPDCRGRFVGTAAPALIRSTHLCFPRVMQNQWAEPASLALWTTDESQGRLDLLGAPLAELGLGVGDDELKRRVWDCGSAALLAVLTA